MSFSIPFAYTVAPESRAEFEAVYGPDGQWARFFRDDEHYVETTLERVAEGEYLVRDHWRSRATTSASSRTTRRATRRSPGRPPGCT